MGKFVGGKAEAGVSGMISFGDWERFLVVER